VWPSSIHVFILHLRKWKPALMTSLTISWTSMILLMKLNKLNVQHFKKIKRKRLSKQFKPQCPHDFPWFSNDFPRSDIPDRVNPGREAPGLPNPLLLRLLGSFLGPPFRVGKVEKSTQRSIHRVVKCVFCGDIYIYNIFSQAYEAFSCRRMHSIYIYMCIYKERDRERMENVVNKCQLYVG